MSTTIVANILVYAIDRKAAVDEPGCGLTSACTAANGARLDESANLLQHEAATA